MASGEEINGSEKFYCKGANFSSENSVTQSTDVLLEDFFFSVKVSHNVRRVHNKLKNYFILVAHHHACSLCLTPQLSLVSPPPPPPLSLK